MPIDWAAEAARDKKLPPTPEPSERRDAIARIRDGLRPCACQHSVLGVLATYELTDETSGASADVCSDHLAELVFLHQRAGGQSFVTARRLPRPEVHAR